MPVYDTLTVGQATGTGYFGIGTWAANGGEPYFGQTFPTIGSTLHSITFEMYQDFKFYVEFVVKVVEVTGTPGVDFHPTATIFTSGINFFGNYKPEWFTINTGNLALDPNKHYAVLFDAAAPNYWPNVNSWSQFRAQYPYWDGQTHGFFYSDNGSYWHSGGSGDIGLYMDFGSAPPTPAAPSDASVVNGFVNGAHNTAAQALTGTAVANSTVSIYDAGQLVGKVAADATGAWSYAVGQLADGSAHSYTVTATTADGTSVASAALGFSVKTSVPTPGAPADAAVQNGYVNAAHNTAAQAIGGTAEANSSLAVYDNGQLLKAVVADQTGAWSYAVGVLSHGSTHSFTVVETDVAGNLSQASGPLQFTVDSQAPLAVAGLADASAVAGVVNAAHNAADQVLAGTAEAGSSVVVYDGAARLGAAVAAADGSWTLALGQLREGVHSFTATATDAAGNTGAASAALQVTVDTAAPLGPAGLADAAVHNGYVNAVNNTAAQALTGGAEAGALVSIYDNGQLLGTASADRTGAWSYALGTLPEGEHSLTATATDAAGNTGAASTTLAFMVDTTAPDAPTGLTDAAVVNGLINAANDTAAQALSGRTEAGALVSIFDHGDLVGTARADGDGAWSYKLGPLGDGGHSLTATATDAAGNAGAASAALQFTVDTVAPDGPMGLAESAVLDGYVNAAHNAATQTLTGKAEAGAVVSVYDNGQLLGTATAGGDGAWSYGLAALSEGEHSFTATATDVAGNAGSSGAALRLVVDTAAPDAPAALADIAVAGGYVNAANDTAAQAVAGRAEAGALVSLFDNGRFVATVGAGKDGVWSYTAGQLEEGAHSFTAIATDAAGNTGAASAALQFVVDTTAPEAASALTDSSILGGYVNAAGNTAAQTLAGQAEPGALVSIFDHGRLVATATADHDGLWSYTPGRLDDGAHSFTAAATDAAGNTGQASAALAFTVDTAAPLAPSLADAAVVNGYVNAANDLATQTLTGHAEAGALVSIFDNGARVATVVAGQDGAWSHTLGALVEGAHTLAAAATDAAGNTGEAGVLAFVVDTVAPLAAAALADSSVRGGYVNAANDVAAQALTGKAEAGATVTVFDGVDRLGTTTAGADGSWSFGVGVLAEGAHALTAIAADPAGNAGAASAALQFTVDTRAPVAPSGVADAAIAGGYVNAAANTAGQTLTGVAEAGSTLTVYDGADRLGTAVAGGDGLWSFTVGRLGEGGHSLTAAATDLAGNTGAASEALRFTVDTRAPAAPTTLADAAVVNGVVNLARDTAAQAVTGVAEAGATVVVYDGAARLGTALAGADGGWSFTLGKLLDGAHSLTATAADTAGNPGIASAALSFQVDTTPPPAPANLADAAVLNGYVNAVNDTAAQSLSGTAEKGATVAIYDGATRLGVATADAATGAWSFTVGRLGEGAHSLTAAATDAAGNTGVTSGPLAFVVDLQAPDPEPDAFAMISNKAGVLSGTGEAGRTVSVYDAGVLVGSTVADANGAWSLSLSLSGNKPHSFTEQQTDAAGNTGVSAALTLVDTNGGSVLTGGGGDDILIGAGKDVLTGGAGHDTFMFNAGFGKETVTDFAAGAVDAAGRVLSAGDHIAFDRSVFADFAAVMTHASQVGSDTIIAFNKQNVLTLANVSLTSLHASDFIFI